MMANEAFLAYFVPSQNPQIEAAEDYRQ